MSTRKAEATWTGKLKDGSGSVKLGSGTYEGSYSFSSRFEQGQGTNPEELIAAAHAGCFSMAFAHGLEENGYAPQRIHTLANVHIERSGNGFKITKIELETKADVPNIDQEDFLKLAQAAKSNCPVSQALAGTDISLQAQLHA